MFAHTGTGRRVLVYLAFCFLFGQVHVAKAVVQFKKSANWV